MSIIFSDNFNSGVPTGWKPPAVISTVNLWGFGGTYCLGCSTNQIQKIFGSPLASQSSVRCQFATLLTTIGANAAIIFIAQDFHSGSFESKFQMVVYINPDGSLSARLADVFLGPTTTLSSSAGVFPVDGTQHGLQVPFTLTAGTLHADFYVDNVLVWSFDFTPTTPWRADNWDNVLVSTWKLPFGGPPNTDITTIDNFEVDDDDAVISWGAGSAPQLDLNRVCYLAPLPPSNGTISIIKQTVPSGSPTSFHVVATGSGLSDFDIVDGQTVSFDVPAGNGYSIVEDAIVGFVTTYTVSNASPNTNINVSADEIVEVTIMNASSLGGIYKVVPGKLNDTLYIDVVGGTQDFKIPDPFAIHYLMGSE